MRRHGIRARVGRTWWVIFATFIATPAVALAVLGLRSIRAAEIERHQHIRDAQISLTRLADAALDEALTRELNPAATLARSSSRFAFVLEPHGVLAFPADRVYFGPFGLKPSLMADRSLPATLVSMVEEAQAAEAQRRYPDARRLYDRLRAVAALSSWVRVRLAVLDVIEGNSAALDVVADVELAASESRTPSGIPLAVAAATYARSADPAARPRFAPLITATLSSLHQGQWWLSADQRQAYDRGLRELLPEADATSAADVRLEQLDTLEPTLRAMASGGRTGRLRFARTATGGVIVAARPPGDNASAWTGTAIVGAAVMELFEHALGPLARGHDVEVALRTRQDDWVWGNVPVQGAWSSAPLDAVDGWELAFTESPLPTRTRALNYGLVLLPVVLLASGLAMTAWVVRRDLALARLQSTFVASVTHEFKSPITSIRLLLERLASRRLQSGDVADRYYAAIGSETDRLEGLVNRLLESQKIQTGQRLYTFVQTSLDPLTRAAVDRLRPHADARHIRIELSVEAGVPDLELDRDSMADAISNLVDNAIKYSPPSSRIAIAVRHDDRGVQIEVADEGIGVDPADAERIFEPFYRSRRGDDANVHGTGLGLTLVKAAAEAHHGSVTVTSDGRRGSRFTLSLPVGQHSRQSVEADRVTSARIGSPSQAR